MKYSNIENSQVVGFEELINLLVTTIWGFSHNNKFVDIIEDNVFQIIHARIILFEGKAKKKKRNKIAKICCEFLTFDNVWGAVGDFYFGIDIHFGIFHKDCRTWVAFGHFRLAWWLFWQVSMSNSHTKKKTIQIAINYLPITPTTCDVTKWLAFVWC